MGSSVGQRTLLPYRFRVYFRAGSEGEGGEYSYHERYDRCKSVRRLAL